MSHNRNCTKTLLLVAFLYGTANAADVLPVGSLDTTSTGKVSLARMLKPGEIKAATQFEGASYVIGLSHFASEGSGLRSMGQEKLARSANRFSLFAGYGVTDWMDIHLGVRSSSETMGSDLRRKFYLDGSPEGSVSSTGGGFGGAVASAKFELLSWKDLRIASLAFYESGVGDAAWQSVTRSEKEKMGLALLSSYTFKSLGQILVNAGYRSRKAEEVGQLYLGNESFLKLSGNYHITPRFGSFITIDTRSIRMADEKNPNRDGWLQYKNTNELGMELGLTGYVYGNYRLTGFVGGTAQKESTGSLPERTFGLSLVVPILAPNNRSEIGMDTKLNKSNDHVSNVPTIVEDKPDAKNSDIGALNNDGSNSENQASDKMTSVKDPGAKDIRGKQVTDKEGIATGSKKESGSDNPTSTKNSKSAAPLASETKKSEVESKSVSPSQDHNKENSALYPEMQIKTSPVAAGVEPEGEFKSVLVDPTVKPAEDPFAAIELELKQIAEEEAKSAASAKKAEEENRKIAAKQWASDQKKKATLDRAIERKVNRKTKAYMVTDKDVSYKGLDN